MSDGEEGKDEESMEIINTSSNKQKQKKGISKTPQIG